MTCEAEHAAPTKERLLYLLGVVLSAPPVISLIQRQFEVQTAPEIAAFIAGYRSLSDAAAVVLHAPMFGMGLPPPPPLIDLHVLSFAGMGMMTKAMHRPGDRIDWFGSFVWAVVAVILAYLLVGILVVGAILARIIANPMMAFRSDHYIETTPELEGPIGRLRRERDMRLERDLARIMLLSLAIVGGYFGLNAVFLAG
jgi:hypothetical protein